MKKLFVCLFAVVGFITTVNAHVVNCTETTNNSVCVTSMDNEIYVDSVTATNTDGSLNKSFAVYCRQLPNGKYRYFVKLGGEEYTVFWAKEYRRFAIQANTLWFFHSRTLEDSFYGYKRAYNA